MKIFVITHGLLAKGLVDSIGLIVGEQKNVKHFSLTLEKNIADFKAEIEEEIANSSENVLCLTDIVNGSPFNIVSELSLRHSNIYHICGVNLPMLLEAALSADVLSEETVNRIIESGKTSIFDVGSFLNEKLSEEF
jgi:mannose/fructose/sorbose-specific phosphotransferase system IIA component